MADEKTTYCKKAATRTESGTLTGTITFAFQDEQKPVVLDMADLNDTITAELAAHGALQKIGDSYASAGGDFKFGRENAQRVIDNLIAGDWRAARAAGERAPTLVLEAVAAVLKISVDGARAKWADFDDETKKAIARDPAVKVEKARIQGERARAELAKKPSTLRAAFQASAS